MAGPKGIGSIAGLTTVYPGRDPSLLNQGRFPKERAF